MVLVPETAYSQMIVQKQEQTDPLIFQLGRLNEQLNTILNDQTISTEAKYLKYNNVLTRYLNLKSQQDFPSKKSVEEPTEVVTKTVAPVSPPPAHSPNQTPVAPRHEQIHLPPYTEFIHANQGKEYRKKGKALAEFVNENLDIFKFDDDHRLIFDGKIVPKSDVIQLINDFSRDRKKNCTPKGANQFGKLLKRANAPRSIIGSKKRYREFVDPQNEPRSPSPSPQKNRTQRHSAKRSVGTPKTSKISNQMGSGKNKKAKSNRIRISWW